MKIKSIMKDDIGIKTGCRIDLTAEERVMICNALVKCGKDEVDINPLILLADKVVKGNSGSLVDIIIDDENVYVSNDHGAFDIDNLSNRWLWILGAIVDGRPISITDNREKLREHQHRLNYNEG